MRSKFIPFGCALTCVPLDRAVWKGKNKKRRVCDTMMKLIKEIRDAIKLATRDVALAQECTKILPTIDNTLSIVFIPLDLKRSSQKKLAKRSKTKIVRSFLVFNSFFFIRFSNFRISFKLIKRYIRNNCSYRLCIIKWIFCE